MHPDTRGFLALVLSLLIAAGLAIVLLQLRDRTERRPEPFAMPVAHVR